MQLDYFFIKMIVLAVPGIVGFKFFTSLQSIGKSRRHIKDWEDFSLILVFSIFSYITLEGLCQILNLALDHFRITVHYEVTSFQAIQAQNISICFAEVVYATIISIILGILAAWISNKKYISKFARKFGITKHYGDEDVWSYLHNSDYSGWIFVRDHKQDLIYYGYVLLFSDSDEKRELLLSEVDVYNNETGEKLYSTDKIYICRDDFDLSIELVENKEESHDKRKPKNSK